MSDFNDNETVTISLKRYHELTDNKGESKVDNTVEKTLAKLFLLAVNAATPSQGLIQLMNDIASDNDLQILIDSTVVPGAHILMGKGRKELHITSKDGLIFRN